MTQNTDNRPAVSGENDSGDERQIALVRENRRLTRQLHRTKELLVTTDELYRSTERVLNKAYADLQGMMEKYQEQNEELHRASRLAAVGEMAGRVVHEVLNPLTGLLGTITKTKGVMKGAGHASALSIAREIVDEWHGHLDRGTFFAYLEKTENDGTPLVQQDIQDLLDLFADLQLERQEVINSLDLIERVVLRITKIIDNMRGVSRTSATVTELDLNVVVELALELYQTQLEKARIRILREFSPGLPTVLADEGEMIQVLSNMLRNSQQAIGSDGVITIRTSASDGRAEVRVSDNGCGIPKDLVAQEMIFESGFTTKPVSEGTGLGLGICRRFMRKHRGDIVVESTAPGVGTTMLIWLPVTPAENATETAGQPAIPAPQSEVSPDWLVAESGEHVLPAVAVYASEGWQAAAQAPTQDPVDGLEAAGALLTSSPRSPTAAPNGDAPTDAGGPGEQTAEVGQSPTFVPARSRYAIKDDPDDFRR